MAKKSSGSKSDYLWGFGTEVGDFRSERFQFTILFGEEASKGEVTRLRKAVTPVLEKASGGWCGVVPKTVRIPQSLTLMAGLTFKGDYPGFSEIWVVCHSARWHIGTLKEALEGFLKEYYKST